MRNLFLAITSLVLCVFATPATAQQFQPPANPCPPNATQCHVQWSEHLRVTRSQYGGQNYRGQRGGDGRYIYYAELVRFAHDLFLRNGGRGNYNPGPQYQREVVILQQQGQWQQGYGSASPPRQSYNAPPPFQCAPGETPTTNQYGQVVSCTGVRVSGPQCPNPAYPNRRRLVQHPVSHAWGCAE